MISKLEFATLGGLIEADGSIGICKNNPTTHIVRVRFFNTDTELIDWVKETFGGRIAVANSNSSYGSKKCLRVEWIGQKSLPILQGIRSYFHGKKQRVVDLAIEHLNCESLEEKEVIAEAIHILNSKGGT